MLSPAQDRIDLFAWLTLANGDETSFANADTQAVAGRLNRERVAVQPSEGGPLNLRCWPSQTTSDIAPEYDEAMDAVGRGRSPPPPPPPSMAAESIIVTGSRIMRAEQEDLGDVKLYRIPEPVTVAARSQKQVALLERDNVRVGFVYRQQFYATDDFEDQPIPRLMVMRNRESEGLGLPLPAGNLVLFEERAGRPILIGEGFLGDRAVGEEVEVRLSAAPGVRGSLRRLSETKDGLGEYELTVSNDSRRPVSYEAEIGGDGVQVSARPRLGRREGRYLWAVTIPANGRATLRYRVSRDG